MTRTLDHSASRRAFIGFLATAAAAGVASQAVAGNNISPIDRVPRHYSIERFTSLDENEVYRIDHASRAGRRITIGNLSPSESKSLLRRAVADWPGTRATLLP